MVILQSDLLLKTPIVKPQKSLIHYIECIGSHTIALTVDLATSTKQMYCLYIYY